MAAIALTIAIAAMLLNARFICLPFNSHDRSLCVFIKLWAIPRYMLSAFGLFDG